MPCLWKSSQQIRQRTKEFFLICMSHDNLFNHYNTNFELMHTHKYSLTELDNMIPFERDIYVHMLNARIREKNQKAGL